MFEKNNKEELIKLINENPDLPVVFFASNNEFCYEYGGTVFRDFYCYKATVYCVAEEVYYEDEEEVIEIYANRLCDEVDYKDLYNEEFEKAIKDYVEQNVEHYDAIVVNMRS